MLGRPRILLLIPHLGGGGAEQVFTLLTQNLSLARYDLHLALITQRVPRIMPFPPGVTVHSLGSRRVRYSAISLLRLVRRLKPRVIVSGMFHLNFLVLILRPLFPRPLSILIRQNGTVSSALRFGTFPAFTRSLYRLLYPRANRILCQSLAMATDLSNQCRLNPERLTVLANPIDVNGIRASLQSSECLWRDPGPNLLAVGRLSREKGFDLLISAFATLRDRLPTVRLVIVGSGPEESALKQQCSNLGLGSAVLFAGQVDRPSAWFPAATAFVLPSRHEAMPNALLEAAAAGLPIVCTPASAGLVELLDQRDGIWIAPEITSDALVFTLHQALSSLAPNQRFQHAFIQDFELNHAIAAYQAVIDQALSEQAR